MKRPDQRKCDACDLAQKRTNVVVSDGGIRKCGLVVVGEAPGAQEDEAGIPFCGPTGKILRDYCKRFGKIVLGIDAIVLNTVSCRPPQNRVPTREERDICLSWLKLNIAIIQPRLVLAVGVVSAKTFLDLKTYGKGVFYQKEYMHECWKMDRYNFEVMPIWHPSYLKRNGMKSLHTKPWSQWIENFGNRAKKMGLL